MNWDDYEGLGRALHEANPDVNHLTVADADLVRLVSALPGFADARIRPDATSLTAVRFAWVAAAEGDDDGSPYDGSA
ncbi:Fe-S cluster assembly protein IscX [Telmatospirillum siberiense]|uniref:Fe-S assembly protein IscX n=1 Tax=Telmatospirillum siberiense TaxID=382514 RepID=A0A2N3Q0V4_9PROT|nr:Fe-S cluster assembly protein IscX [Telmatospirillum siberiense]PKU26286.1 Fe-S assembly protein IscX [Telmatospirillum siberiense]